VQTDHQVTHGRYDARHRVTFPVTESGHLSWYQIILFAMCLVTQARGCEQLASSCYLIATLPRVKPETAWSKVRCPNCYTTKTPN